MGHTHTARPSSCRVTHSGTHQKDLYQLLKISRLSRGCRRFTQLCPNLQVPSSPLGSVCKALC